MTQDPMPLEDLPQYLKSIRENGDSGSSPVVGTGQIVVAKKSWSKVILATLAFLILSAGSVVTYNAMAMKNITVVMGIHQTDDPSQTITKIVSDSGGQVVGFKQNEDSTYEVKVSTRKSKQSFLEWLRKNKDGVVIHTP